MRPPADDRDRMIVVLTVAELDERMYAAALRAARQALAERGDGVPDVVDKHTAKALGLTPHGFLDAVACDAFPHWRQGRRKVAKRADVLAWIDSQRVAQLANPPKQNPPPKPQLTKAPAKASASIAAELASGILRAIPGGRR